MSIERSTTPVGVVMVVHTPTTNDVGRKRITAKVGRPRGIIPVGAKAAFMYNLFLSPARRHPNKEKIYIRYPHLHMKAL